ncbi:cupin domain-containing protein [Candidatus Woesearchaeota archaeon]|nr:cupin domain-containing protein [Candidatus Woesearchaeota archaeon]
MERYYTNKNNIEWQAFQPGVEIKHLHEHQKAKIVMIKFSPGAKVPKHEHEGGEEIYVLDGTLIDEEGTYTKGAYLYNPPKSTHTTHSPEGCTLLVTWFGKVNISH